MKYFVIHSGSDYESARQLMENWSETYNNAQFIVLEGNQQNWEGDATARIRECGKVLYLVGEKSADSPYIQIEIDIANRENKEIYVYKLKDNNRVNDCLLKGLSGNNTMSGEFEGEIIIAKNKDRVFILNDDELQKRMKNDSQELEIILKGGSFADKDILLQQYQMFVQTSEDLVSRKQTVNTFYVTLNSLMLGAIISVVTTASEILQISNYNITYIVSVFLSVIGIVICCSWITLLTSYSDLNASKMAIIACIEERLALKLFDTEWALLTRRIGKKKYKSFTVKEIAVAKIFLALYMLIIITCFVFVFI